jgi:signal transduction histidine kinase
MKLVDTVFKKYALTLAGCVLGVVGLVIIADYVIGSLDARRSASALLRAQAQAAAMQFQANFRLVEKTQAELMSLPWVLADTPTDETRDEFRRFLKLNPAVVQVSHVDAASKKAMSITRTRVDRGQQEPLADPLPAFLDDNALGQYGKVRYSANEKSVQYFSRPTKKDPVAVISELDLRFADRDVRDLRFGKTGVIYLVDSAQRVLAHPDSRYALRETRIDIQWTARGWEQSKELGFIEGESFDGKLVMSTGVKLSPQGWSLIAEQDIEEALAPVRSQLHRKLLTLLVGSVAASALAFAIARKMSAPIVRLSQASKQFASGQFDVRVDTKGGDELATLSRNFNEMADELSAFTSNLELKIEEKTAQLETEFTKREAQAKEITKLEERARIMRDIHDGVGGHLVGLLGAAKREQLEPKAVEAMVQDALVDFRIAIDSLSPSESDITTSLASLKFRLQPRIQSAGLSAQWRLDEVPETAVFTREQLFHIQRIVAEAVTNAVKHATGATAINVNVQWNEAARRVELEVMDDGSGFHPRVAHAGTPSGRGLENMRTRAKAVGGEIEVMQNATGSGTLIRLLLPAGVPTAQISTPNS